MEWRRVHELRPRVSTSAGQSLVTVALGVSVSESLADGSIVALGAFMDLAWAAHAEKALLEVHERQLWFCQQRIVKNLMGDSTYGFPSGPRTTPGGNPFVPGASAVACASVCGPLDCAAISKIFYVATGRHAFSYSSRENWAE